MGAEVGNVVRSTECMCNCTPVQEWTCVLHTHTPELCGGVGGMCAEWSSGMGVFRGVVCVCGVHVHVLVQLGKRVC